MSKSLSIAMLSLFPIIGYAQSELLSSYQWKNRLVILLYDDQKDIELVSQEILINRNKSGFDERAIKVLKYGKDQKENIAIRRDFNLPGSGFVFLLVGKDGYKKLARERRVMPYELFSIIDAMPMRRSEIRSRKDK